MRTSISTNLETLKRHDRSILLIERDRSTQRINQEQSMLDEINRLQNDILDCLNNLLKHAVSQ